MEDFIFVFENLISIFGFILSIWWLYTPVLLFLMLVVMFQNYTQTKYLVSLEWVLLEVRVPKEIRTSPKPMENVFSALHGIHDPPKWRERFFHGKVHPWYSFEIIGKGAVTHFYVRTLKSLRNFVEAQFYAQYPDCEIVEAPEDHTVGLPSKFEGSDYDVFGTEFILTKEDAYPIRTYIQFEELNPGGEPEDIKRIDPIASLSEIFSRLNPGEYMGIQLLAKPTGDAWVKKGQEVIDKILGKKPKPKEGFLTKAVFAIDNLLPGGGGAAPPAEKKEEKKESTPGQYEVLKAVEASLSKLGYEVGIRALYTAPKDVFQKSHIASINGAFKQFSTYNLNGFKWDKTVATPIAKWPFKERKKHAKKIAVFNNFKKREFVLKPIILTTEEMATVYHFPYFGVKSPLLPRIEAKKGEPPTGLPMS